MVQANGFSDCSPRLQFAACLLCLTRLRFSVKFLPQRSHSKPARKRLGDGMSCGKSSSRRDERSSTMESRFFPGIHARSCIANTPPAVPSMAQLLLSAHAAKTNEEWTAAERTKRCSWLLKRGMNCVYLGSRISEEPPLSGLERAYDLSRIVMWTCWRCRAAIFRLTDWLYLYLANHKVHHTLDKAVARHLCMAEYPAILWHSCGKVWILKNQRRLAAWSPSQAETALISILR